MIKDAAAAGLCESDILMAELDRMLADCRESYLESLAEVEKVRAEDFLHRAAGGAEDTWSRIVGGASGPAPIIPRVLAGGAVPSASDDQQEDGVEGVAGGRRGRTTAVHLQKELTALRDRTKLRELEASLENQGNKPQLDRVRELRHAEVSHKWLGHLDTRNGSVLAPADFVVNVQKRLGAISHATAQACRLCGQQLDPQVEHSETCSVAEATKGHYACVRAVVNGLRLADPTVTTEPRGLTSLTSRPADILTNAAVPGRSAALDVCVASPNAAAAMGDAAEAAFRRKLRRYRLEIEELRQARIAFRPMVWTADGRPHPAATRTLKFAAELAASRNSQQASSASLLSRWRQEIQISILRRRAAMYRAVLPRPSVVEHWLLTGNADSSADAWHRLEAIEEDEVPSAWADVTDDGDLAQDTDIQRQRGT